MKSSRGKMTVKRYDSLQAMRDDQMRYWRQQPAYKRLEAAAELSEMLFTINKNAKNARRLQRPHSDLK